MVNVPHSFWSQSPRPLAALYHSSHIHTFTQRRYVQCFSIARLAYARWHACNLVFVSFLTGEAGNQTIDPFQLQPKISYFHTEAEQLALECLCQGAYVT